MPSLSQFGNKVLDHLVAQNYSLSHENLFKEIMNHFNAGRDVEYTVSSLTCNLKLKKKGKIIEEDKINN